jgi:hypothetical protein
MTVLVLGAPQRYTGNAAGNYCIITADYNGTTWAA